MDKNQESDGHNEEDEDGDVDKVHSATRNRKRGEESIEALIAFWYMCEHTLSSVEV